jgi:hypothetical protein
MNRLMFLGAGLFLLSPAFCRADDQDKKKSDTEQSAKDSYERVVRDMLELLKTAAKTLATATDADTAKKAKPELDKIVKTRQELLDRIDKLGVRSKEVEEELTKKFKPELEDAFNAMTGQVERLAKESFGKDLIAILQPKPPVKPPADKPKDK